MRNRRLLIFVVLATLVPAASAQAHAELMSTSPPAGHAVAPPSAVTFTFDDVVQLPPAALRVTGPHGAPVTVHAMQPNSKTLQGMFPRTLAAGAYSVRWRIVADDGHIVSGKLRFSVRAGATHAATAAAPRTPPPPVSEKDTGTAAVVLTLLLCLITIGAIGIALVRLRKSAREVDMASAELPERQPFVFTPPPIGQAEGRQDRQGRQGFVTAQGDDR